VKSATRAIAAALILGGCIRVPEEWPVYEPPAQPTVPQIVADLSRLRGLPLDAPVDVQFLDEAAFRQEQHRVMGARKPSASDRDSYYAAFGMANPANLATLANDLVDEQLVGFYDRKTKCIYVRRRDPRRRLARELRITIAHEAEHALQDRFFDTSAADVLDDADQSLALRALFEGEATLASAVFEETYEGGQAAEVISRLEGGALGREAEYLRTHGGRLSTDAPPILRAQLEWPYFEGVVFVATLAASGGWELVNAALRNPPQTTEQVLHVEKYIAGEGAIEVQTPKPLEGYTLVGRGRMGELQTRFLLAECMTDEEAAQTAAGWGGDAYAILTRGAEQVLLWSTAWDDERAASRFEAALRSRRACARTGEKPPFSVVRDGTHVAFVQGLGDDAARSSAAAPLLELARRAHTAVPPLGPVSLREGSPLAAYLRGREASRGGQGSESPLEISSVLKDLKVSSKPGFELFATGKSVAVGAMAVWAPPSAVGEEQQVADFVEGLHKKSPYATVLDGGTRRVHLAWTDADERALRLGDSLEMRLVFAPACDGRMTVLLLTSWRPKTPGLETAALWRESVRARATDRACAALRNLRDPARVAD
jgi:hypothetical protein